MVRCHFFLLSIFGFSSCLVPKSRLDHVFSRHTHIEINGIFDVLYQYSCEKSKACSGVTKERFANMGQGLWKGREYIKKRKNNTVYLGWTPLLSDSTQDYEVLRNDNSISSDDSVDQVNPKYIPLYFIFMEVLKDIKALSVEKIVYNPSIDVKIPPSLLKEHLECLAIDSNTTLKLDNLKYYDYGRWYLEFCMTTHDKNDDI